jgi:hypothetical protein
VQSELGQRDESLRLHISLHHPADAGAVATQIRARKGVRAARGGLGKGERGGQATLLACRAELGGLDTHKNEISC